LTTDSRLAKFERRVIADTLAFMSYNPSIGRVLGKEGVRAFAEMAWARDEGLRRIMSRGAFDHFHAEWTRAVRRRIQTSRGRPCSYGQAQKPINVYLKVYVDHAGRPDASTARRLRPFLHVPLDSLLMTAILKRNPARGGAALPRMKDFSLEGLDKRRYLQWQRFFRQRYAAKPVLFDTVWWLARNRKRVRSGLRKAGTTRRKAALKRQVACYDRNIDALVRDLCGLTKAEVGSVERSV